MLLILSLPAVGEELALATGNDVSSLTVGAWPIRRANSFSNRLFWMEPIQ